MATVSSVGDIKTRGFWVAVLAELLGTLLLVLVGCGSCASFPTTDAQNKVLPVCDPKANIVQIAIAFGLSVATIVWVIARVSGGHINPAVTFGLVLMRKITILRALFYIVAQCVGALLGALLLKAASPSAANPNLGHASPNPLMNAGQTTLVELLITFVLVITVYATCDSLRKDLGGSGPLAIGLSIAMCHLWAIPYTGSGMNPARVLGPAVVAGKFKFEEHWPYWIGPLIGAALAALLYDFVMAVNADVNKLKACFSRNYDESELTSHDTSASERTPLKAQP